MLAPGWNPLHSATLRIAFTIGPTFPLPPFPSSPVEVLFDLEGGNEAQGVMISAFGVGHENKLRCIKGEKNMVWSFLIFVFVFGTIKYILEDTYLPSR
jgi:hypothetical protein